MPRDPATRANTAADGEPPTRRERKKAATRSAIADAALDLFLDRGYHDVTVQQIADHADVAVTTLFKHFEGKVALVFDRDADIEQELASTVLDRPADSTILDAVEAYVLTTPAAVPTKNARYRRFRQLIASTPELDAYWSQMWMRHSEALAEAVHKASLDTDRPLSKPASLSLARSAMSAVDIARHSPKPVAAVNDIFALMRQGWPH